MKSTLCYLVSAMVALFVSTNLFAQQTVQDWANFHRYADADAKVVSSGVKPKAVLIGDSITDFWVFNDNDFFTSNNYVGRGISGQTSSQMLVRFRSDVIELEPEYVVILAGTNDLAQNTGYISKENILGNIVSMCELARANNIEPVICSVPPSTKFSWREELGDPSQEIIALNKMLKEYSTKNNIPYVDYHSALKDENNGLKFGNNGDSVHPGLEGYKIMADILKPVLK